jgi:2-(1,2-epoxy-1,2-dihydrophenyl)acetyl-CoA isomerase
MQPSVLTTDHGNWVEITLNRPDRLNSFTDEMHLMLRRLLNDALEGGARAILLTGAGRGFCAGQDLGDRDPSKMDGPPDLSYTLTTFYNPLVAQLQAARIPVVCAVNGVAAGAGVNIALACDIVLAAHRAKFIQSFAKVGLVPDAGGTWQLTRLLGTARAKAMAMLAEPLSAQQAADWGMIWKAIPDDALMVEARAMAEKLANGPTFGIGSIKHALNAAPDNSLNDQMALEARLQKTCGESPDYAEGVSAFLEKRAATFTGNAP